MKEIRSFLTQFVIDYPQLEEETLTLFREYLSKIKSGADENEQTTIYINKIKSLKKSIQNG
jgi:hypothetical protein